MNISDAGRRFIEGWEQCRLVAYRDVRGRWTIGWGHTGTDVYDGLEWTQDQADEAFERDLGWVEAAINQLVSVPLTQNQFDALASFVYNVGRTQFSMSTLLRRINERNFVAARLQFSRWNKATVDGILVPETNLTQRRAAEAALFAT